MASGNNGLPAWLTAGNGGTGAPIPISAWLSPDYPGGYAGWLSDHPNPGNGATPPSNQVYKAWLQQQVGPDGQLHLPPASAVAGGAAAPSPAPAAPVSGTTIAEPHPGNIDGGAQAPVPAPAVPHETIPMPGPATIPNESIGGNGHGNGNNGNGGTAAPAKTHGQASNGGTSAPADVADTDAGNGGVTAQSGNGNKLTISQRRGFRSSGSSHGSQDVDGAIADAGDGFPTTSSYPASDGTQRDGQVADASRDRKNGWGGGTGDVAKDPAQVATYLNTQQNTDPLNIKGDKTNS